MRSGASPRKGGRRPHAGLTARAYGRFVSTLAPAPGAPRVRPPGPAAAARSGGSAVALGACLLLGLVLRLPYGHVALGVDEGGVAWVARQWTSGHGSLYGGQWLDRPPLLVALYRLADAGGPLGVRALGAVAALSVVATCFALGRRLGGFRAAWIAGLLAALLTGSVAIAAVFTPAELLAAVPSGLSVLALLRAWATGRSWPVALAGLLALSALAIKQSSLDAGLAGVAFLVATTATRGRRPGARATLAYLAGVGLALLAVAGWLVAAHVRPGALFDALIGFRITSLHALQGSNLPLATRLTNLGGPALGSGLGVLVPLAAWGIRGLRTRPVAAWTLAAWLAGGVVGVLGGGSYWPHYLIELVPVAAVGSALVLTRLPRRVLRTGLLAATGLAVLAAAAGDVYVAAHPPHAVDARIARYVQRRARAGDTFYALYAHAELNAAVGLPTPFRYSWSLMMRARPDARPRLVALLRSSRRPTWIMRWQPPAHWQLDRDGELRRLLATRYRRVATFEGRPLLHVRAEGRAG